MLLKITDIILLVLFFLSLSEILFIILRKFPVVANLNLSELPQEKGVQTKKKILQRKLQKLIERETTEFKKAILFFKKHTPHKRPGSSEVEQLHGKE